MDKNIDFQIVLWDNIPELNKDQLIYFQYILKNIQKNKKDTQVWRDAIQQVGEDLEQVDCDGFPVNSFVVKIKNNSKIISIRFFGETVRLENKDAAIAFAQKTIDAQRENYSHTLFVIDLCLDPQNIDYSIGLELCNKLEAADFSVLRVSSVFFQESNRPIVQRAANNSNKMVDDFCASGPSVLYSAFLKDYKEWKGINQNVVDMLSFLLRSQYTNKQYLGAVLYSVFNRINEIQEKTQEGIIGDETTICEQENK